MKLWTAGTRPSSRHRCRAAVAWCLSVLLAGCGAGVVGTGSGKVDRKGVLA